MCVAFGKHVLYYCVYGISFAVDLVYLASHSSKFRSKSQLVIGILRTAFERTLLPLISYVILFFNDLIYCFDEI